MTLHWSTLSGKRINFRRVSMLWFLFTQRKNFTCSILLCHSIEIGFHQMVPLILKEKQPGGQLKPTERIYFTRCMNILKVNTRNGQMKAGKGEFSIQPLKEEEEPEENPSTHICCTSSGSILIFWQ